MVQTKKVRKSPSDSATKFSIGTRRKGNDGNMWKITQDKNGKKRWQRITSGTSKASKTIKKTVRQTKMEKIGKNELDKLREKLATGESVVLVYTNGKIMKQAMPKTLLAYKRKLDKLDNDITIDAIIRTEKRPDIYETIQKKVNGKSLDEILKNYKKYLFNYGNDGYDNKFWHKHWYV